MKDNFSKQAGEYAKFRPGYPERLFMDILALVKTKNKAWDCATGNGQVASMIAPFFERVEATDISEKQLENAVLQPNIRYSLGPAEETAFPHACFDLITVGQAVHWFDFEKFNQEISRVAKPGCILALIGYSLFKTDSPLDGVIQHFYEGVVGSYWDKERRYIDEAYSTIPFPFKEIAMPDYSMEYEWDIETMVGYLGTWSAVQHYINANGHDPILLIVEELKRHWGNVEKVKIHIQLLTRIGMVG